MTLQSGSPESSTTKTKCLVCGSKTTRPSDGFIVCTECGTCQDREVVHGVFSFREGSYEGATQYTDLGNKMHMVNTQGSRIGYEVERQSIFKASKVLRLRRVHNWTLMRIENCLLQGLKCINKAAVQLQLPTQTRDRAAYLLRRMLQHYKIHRGQKPLLVCVLVLAIREHRLPLTEGDVLEIIPIQSRHKYQLNRAKFFIMNHLGIRWPTHRPECFIPKIISTIRKNPMVLERLERMDGTQDYFNRLERLSTRLLQSMTFNNYGARSPEILAASAVYTIDSRLLHITSQEDAGETVGSVGHSIRDHHNSLWKSKSDQIKELLEVAE